MLWRARTAAAPDVTQTVTSKTAAAAGCGACAIKSAQACQKDLTQPASIIAGVFVQSKKIFNQADQRHLAAVSAMLEHDLKDPKTQRPLGYKMPTDPRVRTWFLNMISQQVRAGLG